MSKLSHQKKLLREPRDPQQIIEKFIIRTLNTSSLINYEHIIIKGVTHSIKEINVSAKSEEYNVNDSIIKQLSIDFTRNKPKPFVSGSIKIPVGHLMSVSINLYATERKVYPGSILPIDIFLHYGIFTKRSGIVKASRVGTVVFKVIFRDAEQLERNRIYIGRLESRYPKVFHILTEEEETAKPEKGLEEEEFEGLIKYEY
jgi:hypothetical protein